MVVRLNVPLVCLFAFATACGEPIGPGRDAAADTGPARTCTPGETRSCACLNGVGMGAQQCQASGMAYGDCMPCTAARCGDGTCNGTETCSSCPADCMPCTARCGDGTCNGTENCMTCASDCGMCMMMVRCGDGRCSAPDETCMNCSDDCGACPPRCGDGTCNGTETCTSCVADCGACETMCMSCAFDSDCPTGANCGVRRCDGVRGCYASLSATCALIGGVRCPPTSAYNLCATDTECGPYAVCQRFGDGRRFCARRCGADVDCPSPPTGSTTVPACDTANTPRTCFLTCAGPGTCPFGLSCFRFMDGRYGYCS